jgi:hypothetical protein
MALLLLIVLSVEALTMRLVYRGVSRTRIPQETTLDPAQFFQSLSQP